MKIIAILILSCFLVTSCNIKTEKTCYITGKVINRNSKTLILIKQTEDATYCGLNIPIDSTGSFNHQLNSPFIEAYELVFEDEHDMGVWQPVLFFNDADTIRFILYPMEKADSNIIVGSKLSLKQNEFYHQIRTTFEKQFDDLNRKIDSITKNSNPNSIESEKLFAESDSLRKEIVRWQLRYLKDEADLFGYSKFYEILRSEKSINAFPIDSLKKYYVFFQKMFPNHPYNTITQNLINGLENIKPGGLYVDFTAPDSKGTNIRISNFISKNKLTLIDLWAPWCSPCISKSKSVIPIFNEFQDIGFGVIGVVGGISNNKQFHSAIEKYQYPWILLSEISDKNKIWEKYNISKSGGSQFLVNQQGKILSINPSPDELIEFIMKE